MANQKERESSGRQRPAIRDLGQLVAKLFLALAVIGWFLRAYLQEQALDPFTLLILLLLLAILVWLILRQRHVVRLRCELTAPDGCVRGVTDILPDRVLQRVAGRAEGLGFSHYLLEVRSPGGDLLSDVVVYPDGAGTPDPSLGQGNRPVTSGTLGWIDVEKAAEDAGLELLDSTTFDVTLRVFGVDGSELSPRCTISFDLSFNEVYIRRVSTPWSVDFTDPDERLRRSSSPSADLATVGGRMHVRGAADVYGCADEKIEEYTLWAIPDDTFSFTEPAALSSISPEPDWVQVAHVEFNAQTVDGTAYDADQVRSYNRLDGDPEPHVLTNVWGTRRECVCAFLDATVHCSCWKVPDLEPSAFQSDALPELDSAHEGGTGKFTFLLQVIDTAGNAYYDVQRAWVDNEPIEGAIEGIGGLAPCEDLYTKDRTGAFRTVDVEGTAWDRLIDPGDPTKPTSDNFGRYTVHFQKQSAAGEVELESSPDPVPARPQPLGVGTLVEWDLETVDRASNPLGQPDDQLLDPGEECTYNVILRVRDQTVVNEGGPHRTGKILFPVKLINSSEPSP